MKVLLINGSPHAQGCTYTALSVVADELQKNGVETEIVHVGHKDIRGCIGCYKCRELGRCVFDKDVVNELSQKFAEADGLVVGSPVYYAGMNGTLKSLLDRLFFSAPFPKRFKVGAAVAVTPGGCSCCSTCTRTTPGGCSPAQKHRLIEGSTQYYCVWESDKRYAWKQVPCNP